MRKRNIILFEDDFKKFELGEFPYDRDHSATGEYHYVVEEGYRGAWIDQVCNYTYNGSGPTWIITEDEGRHFMEQQRIEKNKPHRIFPTLQTGNLHWKDYTYSVLMHRISTKGMAGIAFCMQNSLNTLVFSLEKDKAVLSHRWKEDVIVLAEKEFLNDADTYYTMTVEIVGDKVTCYINDQTVLEYTGELVARGGKIAITADCPTKFSEVCVKVSEETLAEIQASEHAEAEAFEERRKSYPEMKLVKKIDLKNFGTSRQVRFGHLTGTDEWFIVLGQAQKRVNRDAYAHMNCITAIDLDGNVLWQFGEPSANSKQIGKVSADLPLQVYDIDGDGVDEVICGRNFEILILDGRTGEIKKRAKTPLSDDDDSTLLGPPYKIYAFDRINPDGIRICNFSGKDRPSDILIKDRYCRVYALDSDLNLLFKYRSPKNTGHYPYAIDINGDGHDELLCGYTMLDHTGKEMWTYPINYDHTDEIVPGKFVSGSDKGYFACVSGTMGFFIGDFEGNIVARDMIGHAQRISVAQYRPGEGFQLAVSNYWGHQGIIYLYDCHGNQIWEVENEMNGNILAPVNWTGDGTDFILTNPDPHKGGLLNGNGERVVAFPDDGHPTYCCEAIDLFGDSRDELVVWDYKSMYIYTQDGETIPDAYKPVKYPHYNASNYRGEFSYPDESYITFKKED